MTLKEARAAGAMFYTGKACKRHPELEGRKRTKSHNCPACQRERMAKRRKKLGKEDARRQRMRRDAIRAGTHVPRKYRRANEKATSSARASG